MKKVIIASLLAMSIVSVANAGFKSRNSVECTSTPDGRGGFITVCR